MPTTTDECEFVFSLGIFCSGWHLEVVCFGSAELSCAFEVVSSTKEAILFLYKHTMFCYHDNKWGGLHLGFFLHKGDLPFLGNKNFSLPKDLTNGQVISWLLRLFLLLSNLLDNSMLLLSRFSLVGLCPTPQTAAHQAPPSLGFSRQEHWSGLPFPSPMHESEKSKWSRSVVSDPQWPHGLQPSRLLHPWDFPGKSTGVGCHCLLQYYHEV